MKGTSKLENTSTRKKYLKKIGNIRLLKEIGRGASAIVYKGIIH